MTHNDRSALEREQAIDGILAIRSGSSTGNVGIYGADVCALCGEIGTFRGWAKAMFGCHYGPHRELVCDECRGSLIPAGETGVSEHDRLIGAELAASDVRYCRLCQDQMQRHPSWGVERSRFVRLCKPCRLALNAEGLTDLDEIAEMLREFTRRRYLELLDGDELKRMGKDVAAMKRELDSWREGSR